MSMQTPLNAAPPTTLKWHENDAPQVGAVSLIPEIDIYIQFGMSEAN